MANNHMQNESQQFRVVKLIPLVISWSAGTPSVSWNPENESIALTDNGPGDVTVTLSSASLVPLKVMGLTLEVADANTLSLEANIDGAPTTTVVKLVANSGADGATETDPVAMHLMLAKVVAA